MVRSHEVYEHLNGGIVRLDSAVHVYPLAQEEDHDLQSTQCACLPEIEIQPNGVLLVIHNWIKGC